LHKKIDQHEKAKSKAESALANAESVLTRAESASAKAESALTKAESALTQAESNLAQANLEIGSLKTKPGRSTPAFSCFMATLIDTSLKVPKLRTSSKRMMTT